MSALKDEGEAATKEEIICRLDNVTQNKERYLLGLGNAAFATPRTANDEKSSALSAMFDSEAHAFDPAKVSFE